MVGHLFASALGSQVLGCGQFESVNPGINAFLEAGLEVGQWVERFEREGREVYDQRMAVLEAIDQKTGGGHRRCGCRHGSLRRLVLG